MGTLIEISDWKVESLSEFCGGDEFIIDGPFGSNLKNEHYVSSGVPVLTGGNISKNTWDFKNIRFISDQKAKELSRCNVVVGDLLSVKIGSVGFSSLVTDLGGFPLAIIPANLLRLRVKNCNSDPIFLKHVLQFEGTRKELLELATSTAQPALNLRKFRSLKIRVPQLAEQKVIGKTLSDIDELIESIDSEIYKKQNILKGFMQNLVSGSYFKKNNISFEIKQIKNLPIDIQRGQLITGTTTVDGKIPVIAGGISAAYYNNVANRFGATVTISASGANAGFVNLWRSDIWASDCSTIGESEEYEILYIFHLLKEKQNELFDAQYGGGQPHIRPKEIGEILIPWISKANQTDIVLILEGLSKELELLEEEKTKYKYIKQGMAHNLLTGKVRLV